MYRGSLLAGIVAVLGLVAWLARPTDEPRRPPVEEQDSEPSKPRTSKEMWAEASDSGILAGPKYPMWVLKELGDDRYQAGRLYEGARFEATSKIRKIPRSGVPMVGAPIWSLADQKAGRAPGDR